MNPSSSYGDAFIDEYISWVEAQRSSASEPDFLYLTTWAGLANRLIALLSAFALALATKHNFFGKKNRIVNKKPRKAHQSSAN